MFEKLFVFIVFSANLLITEYKKLNQFKKNKKLI